MAWIPDTSERVRFDARKMQKCNLFTTEHFFCDLYAFEPGQEQTAHAHAGSDKVYFVLEGTLEIRLGEQTRTLGPRGAALAEAGVAHAVRNPGPGRALALVFLSPRP
ncbi:MAG: cupin [Candidatus Binatia bacterium]|nr:MAG: cupin [Candidatus Binatia bacterium]